MSSLYLKPGQPRFTTELEYNINVVSISRNKTDYFLGLPKNIA